MKFTSLFLAVLGSTALVQQATAADFSYDNLSVNYIDADYTVFNDDYAFTGYGLNSSFAVAENTYVYGKLAQLTNDDYAFEPKIQTAQLGAGLYVPFSGAIDFNASIGYFKQNIEFGALIDTDDTGFVMTAGLIAQVGQTAEIQVEAENFLVDGESDTMMSFAARFHASKHLVPELTAQKSNDFQSFGAGLQFRF